MRHSRRYRFPDSLKPKNWTWGHYVLIVGLVGAIAVVIYFLVNMDKPGWDSDKKAKLGAMIKARGIGACADQGKTNMTIDCLVTAICKKYAWKQNLLPPEGVQLMGADLAMAKDLAKMSLDCAKKSGCVPPNASKGQWGWDQAGYIGSTLTKLGMDEKTVKCVAKTVSDNYSFYNYLDISLKKMIGDKDASVVQYDALLNKNCLGNWN